MITRKGDFPARADISIAKNYLDEDELKILNNLVSGYFDFAEIQAMRHNLMHMSDYVQQLDKVLSSTGEQVQTLSPVEEAYLDTVKTLEKEVNKNKK
ncbi:RhuM family protein [Hornefia porci]|uniref:RhuM family protein n=1 Tax=Hornefia porci TaxID=2652292 RepID=UPI00095189CD